MPRADRLAYAGLAMAMAASAALLLWTTRGLTFYNDEIGWFVLAPADYDPGMLLHAHNTHLIALPRLLYTASLDLFGPDYLPLRVIAVLGVLLCAGAFFVLARRRIGAPAALVPAVVLLFFGTAWNVVVSPVGIPFLYATAAGLAALVAVERHTLRGDLAAGGLTALSLASHSIGVSFLAGIAVSVLLRRDRLKRSWVFAVPLALYALWWMLASGSTGAPGSLADPSNALGLPVFIASSLGAVVTSLAGLNLTIDPAAAAGFNRLPTFTWTLVPVLAIGGLVAAVLSLRRGRISPELWVFAATLLVFWVSIGLSAGPDREPTTPRYLFPGAVMLGLVAVEALRDVRVPGRAIPAVLAIVALSLAVNVVHTQEARRFLLAYSENARSTLAMIELAGANGTPTFKPAVEAPGASPRHIGVSAAGYLAGAAKWGSLAAPLPELRRATAVVRSRADIVLARSYGLALEPASAELAVRPCVTVGDSDRSVAVQLPLGGAVLRTDRGGGGPLALRRFGDTFSIAVGQVSPTSALLLEIPSDRAREPWIAALPPGRFRVCRTRAREARAQRYCSIVRRLESSRGRPEGASRTLLNELLEVAPPDLRADLRTVIGGAGGRAAAAAQARIEAFEAARCG